MFDACANRIIFGRQDIVWIFCVIFRCHACAFTKIFFVSKSSCLFNKNLYLCLHMIWLSSSCKYNIVYWTNMFIREIVSLLINYQQISFNTCIFNNKVCYIFYDHWLINSVHLFRSIICKNFMMFTNNLIIKH